MHGGGPGVPGYITVGGPSPTLPFPPAAPFFLNNAAAAANLKAWLFYKYLSNGGPQGLFAGLGGAANQADEKGGKQGMDSGGMNQAGSPLSPEHNSPLDLSAPFKIPNPPHGNSMANAKAKASSQRECTAMEECEMEEEMSRREEADKCCEMRDTSPAHSLDHAQSSILRSLLQNQPRPDAEHSPTHPGQTGLHLGSSASTPGQQPLCSESRSTSLSSLTNRFDIVSPTFNASRRGSCNVVMGNWPTTCPEMVMQMAMRGLISGPNTGQQGKSNILVNVEDCDSGISPNSGVSDQPISASNPINIPPKTAGQFQSGHSIYSANATPPNTLSANVPPSGFYVPHDPDNEQDTPVCLAKRNLHPVSSRVFAWISQMISFCKEIPVFKGLSGRDQLHLLQLAWHRLLILYMAENNFHFVVSTLTPNMSGNVSSNTSSPSPTMESQALGVGVNGVGAQGNQQAAQRRSSQSASITSTPCAAASPNGFPPFAAAGGVSGASNGTGSRNSSPSPTATIRGPPRMSAAGVSQSSPSPPQTPALSPGNAQSPIGDEPQQGQCACGVQGQSGQACFPQNGGLPPYPQPTLMFVNSLQQIIRKLHAMMLSPIEYNLLRTAVLLYTGNCPSIFFGIFFVIT